MSSCLQSVLVCLGYRRKLMHEPTDEKQALLTQRESSHQHHDHDHDHDRDDDKPNNNKPNRELRPESEIADQILTTLLISDKLGTTELHRTLDEIVGTNGWTENLAKWLLVKLEAALKQAETLKPAIKEAYDKACEAALSIEGS